ncbi:unnamed protein product [Periconia digitata]|uniref:Transcriptional activator of proteases prtT n=1 Tax=Periconia digitata TaxID=1303443 RepID=A0A9W4XHR3_9PLEO|nr:unnamed protein product [Periconia digitata]
MPPERILDRGRASKACSACRKQKTRCYDGVSGKSCLRCERLGNECSLITEVRMQWTSNAGTDETHNDHERIERLEQLVATFARRLDDVESILPPKARYQDRADGGSQVQYDRETEAFSAPLFVLRDAATQSGLRVADDTTAATPARAQSDDIILQGLLSEEEATFLLNLFRESYGRWVAFDSSMPIQHLLQDARKSPILLVACCLIAVRNTSATQAARLAPGLCAHVKKLLSQAMLSVPQPIDFFQSVLVLSLWSTTVGKIPLGIDGWLLSGFALQHSMASSLFVSSSQELRNGLEKTELDHLCIWNHICLAHLHYCVGTHRRSVLTQDDVSRCRLILSADHATNFESRMVAEVHLYWIIYQNCNTWIDLPKAQAALNSWKMEWGFLLDQPDAQFIQMGFWFAQLLFHDRALRTQPTLSSPLFSEMIRLSTSIMKCAIESSDHQTPYLTDHIFHMISFAAVTLCRLLHKNEEQLSSTHSIQALDNEVIAVVVWLHGVGLPCHVAHTMGDVVLAIHSRLRPEFNIETRNQMVGGVDEGVQEDFALLFPEFYGLAAWDVINGSMLPTF